jgi:hypothetical protein
MDAQFTPEIDASKKSKPRHFENEKIDSIPAPWERSPTNLKMPPA